MLAVRVRVMIWFLLFLLCRYKSAGVRRLVREGFQSVGVQLQGRLFHQRVQRVLGCRRPITVSDSLSPEDSNPLVAEVSLDRTCVVSTVRPW